MSSAETVDLGDFFTWPAEVREQWHAWARHHGIDPNAVALGSLERRPVERQIRYFTYDFSSSPVRQVGQVVQLEAAPSPFPGSPRP